MSEEVKPGDRFERVGFRRTRSTAMGFATALCAGFCKSPTGPPERTPMPQTLRERIEAIANDRAGNISLQLVIREVATMGARIALEAAVERSSKRDPQDIGWVSVPTLRHLLRSLEGSR